jgi:FAD:protein FMN transferase
MLGGDTMGTSWQVQLAPTLPIDVRDLELHICARLDAIIGEMSHWLPSSVLSRFNALPGGQWLPLPPDFSTVIAAGLAVATRSDGAFDPAIGELVDLWGHGPRGPQPLPDEAMIHAVSAASGWRRLEFDPAARRLKQPGGARLDLSGIAKGFAVDAAAQMIAEAGHHNYLVEIGGELTGRGLRPDGDPWWVELENVTGDIAPLRLALHELSVATSGDYVRGAHTIDPRTGYPSQTPLVAVTVVHRSTMLADAWASAIIVLGPEDGRALAEHEGLAARMLVRTPSGRSEEILTSAFAAMMVD